MSQDALYVHKHCTDTACSPIFGNVAHLFIRKIGHYSAVRFIIPLLEEF